MNEQRRHDVGQERGKESKGRKGKSLCSLGRWFEEGRGGEGTRQGGK